MTLTGIMLASVTVVFIVTVASRPKQQMGNWQVCQLVSLTSLISYLTRKLSQLSGYISPLTA